MFHIVLINEKNKENELVVASIVGGMELAVSVTVFTDYAEALAVLRASKLMADMFIVRQNRLLRESIRQIKAYANTPILFLTSQSYNAVGFDPLTTQKGCERENYICLPAERIDVQAKVAMYLEGIMARKQAEGNVKDNLLLRHDEGLTAIPREHILFAEVQDKRVFLHTDRQTYCLSHSSLTAFLAEVGDDVLLRCHKSFAVNVGRIKALKRAGKRLWQADFAAGEGVSCPVSATCYAEIERAFRAIQGK